MNSINYTILAATRAAAYTATDAVIDDATWQATYYNAWHAANNPTRTATWEVVSAAIKEITNKV